MNTEQLEALREQERFLWLKVEAADKLKQAAVNEWQPVFARLNREHLRAEIIKEEQESTKP